jgi:5-methylcytosine-specific restriction endonuclease McrA
MRDNTLPRKIVETPYAGGRWSEARYKSFIRSLLRRGSMRWPPIQDALIAVRRTAIGRSKQTKWEYQCANCSHWFLRKEVQVDHIVECGSLDDLNRFVATLFCEESNLQVLCDGCHQAKPKPE